MTNHNHTVVVFGGNGFVGVRVLERLADKGVHSVCVSRTGSMPVYLRGTGAPWLGQVDWVRGDASKPDLHVLANADAVITLVGSPPMPTFSKEAMQRQIFMNGDTNAGAIHGAAMAGIKRVVLLGAHMPKLMQTPHFGYYVGKQRAFESAKKFAALSPEHSATVVRPTAIYGTRFTAKGKPIPLDKLMEPVAKIQLSIPRFIWKMLPEPFVSVNQVATVLANAAVSQQPVTEKFTIVENEKILSA